MPVLRDASLVTRTARLCHRRGGEQAGPEVIRFLGYWAPQADEDGYLPELPERARLGRYQRRTGLGSSSFYGDQAATVAGGWMERVQAPGGRGRMTTRYRLRLVPQMVPADPPPGLTRDLVAGWEQECARRADDLARHSVLLRPGSSMLVDADGVARPRARELDGAVVHRMPKRARQELAHVRRTGRLHRRVMGREKARARSVPAARRPPLPPGEFGPHWTRFDPSEVSAAPLPESGPEWFGNVQVEAAFSNDRLETYSLYKKVGPVIPAVDLETSLCSSTGNYPTPPGIRHPGHARARGAKTWKDEKGRGKGPRASSGAGHAPVSPAAIALLGEVMGMWIAELGPTRVLWVPDAYDLAHVVPGPPIYGIDHGSALRLARLIASAQERTTTQEIMNAARAAGTDSAVEPVRAFARRLRRICRDIDRAQYRPTPIPAALDLAEWLIGEVPQFRPVPVDMVAHVFQPLAQAGWTREDLAYWLGLRPLPTWYIQATSGSRMLDPWQLPAQVEHPLALLTHRCSGLPWQGFVPVAEARGRADEQARARTRQWTDQDERAHQDAWEAEQRARQAAALPTPLPEPSIWDEALNSLGRRPVPGPAGPVPCAPGAAPAPAVLELVQVPPAQAQAAAVRPLRESAMEKVARILRERGIAEPGTD